jgi:nitroreductase
MGSFEDALMKRRSIRAYKDIPVEKEKWGKMVIAGNMAPSSGNLQTWRFILMEEADLRKKVASLCYEQTWMEHAPLHIIICADVDQCKKFYGDRGEHLYAIQNTAAAAENMMLAAADMGLSTCWVGAFDEHRIAQLVQLPSEFRPMIILTVGYANEEKPAPQRHAIYRYTFHKVYGGTGRTKDGNVAMNNVSLVLEKRLRQTKGFFNSIIDKIKRVMKK